MKQLKKFLFVVPNTRWFGKRYWLWFVPSLPVLIPILKKHGWTVDVVEANIDNLSRSEMAEQIRVHAPDIVGISNMSLEYWRQAHHVAEAVKKIDPHISTIMGGVHPTTLPRKVMSDPNVDYIVLSEGEERLPKLLEQLQSGSPDLSGLNGIGYREKGEVIIKEPAGWVEDLDALPFPDYRIFNWQTVMNCPQKSAVGLGSRRQPVGAMITSRGCRNRCCFCAGPVAMGRRVRFRSPESVLAEVDMLVRDYGIKELIFMDDEMYADRERGMKIVKGLKDRNYDLIWKNLNLASWKMDFELMKLMKESGCYQMTISPESGSERVLKKIIHKPGTKQHSRNVARWCKELDIELDADFVIGFPGETWEEIRETMRFAEELDVDAVKFAIATPFPGTELFENAVKGGYLPEDFEFYRDDTLGFAHGLIETEDFTVQELEMLRCFEWDRINFKNREKQKRYARMNLLTMKELDAFRRNTRRNVGQYFVDQVEAERKEDDVVKTGTHWK